MDKDCLRPVSYVDDLESIFDAVWLAATKKFLETYSGMDQGGGKYEHLLLVLGVVMVLQARARMGLPTLV